MKTTRFLLAAGFMLAGLTAAGAESAFEPTNAVPNGLTSKSGVQILQLTATPAGGSRKVARPALPTRADYHKTRNSGFARGYTTFDVLDSIK